MIMRRTFARQELPRAREIEVRCSSASFSITWRKYPSERQRKSPGLSMSAPSKSGRSGSATSLSGSHLSLEPRPWHASQAPDVAVEREHPRRERLVEEEPASGVARVLAVPDPLAPDGSNASDSVRRGVAPAPPSRAGASAPSPRAARGRRPGRSPWPWGGGVGHRRLRTAGFSRPCPSPTATPAEAGGRGALSSLTSSPSIRRRWKPSVLSSAASAGRSSGLLQPERLRRSPSGRAARGCRPFASGNRCCEVLRRPGRARSPRPPCRRRAVRHADAREQQPQVVVDLGRGRDGRARVAARVLLVDRDRRRQPLERVERRPVEPPEELARVGREALDEPPLALGEERVEREARLARARRPGDDRELVPPGTAPRRPSGCCSRAPRSTTSPEIAWSSSDSRARRRRLRAATSSSRSIRAGRARRVRCAMPS